MAGRIAILIPTYNRWEIARSAIASIQQSLFKDFVIFLIEDGCKDGTAEKCRNEFPAVQILHGDGNLWWSGAINKGIEYALDREIELVFWLNDDNRVEPDALGNIVAAYDSLAGQRVISARVKSMRDGEDEWIGAPPKWSPDYDAWQQPENLPPLYPLAYPPGGRGVLVPTRCFKDVGIIDQKVFPHYWADHDFHYRAMNAGYKYYLASDAVIWNRPYVEPKDAPDKYSLKWITYYFFNRGSSTNLIILRRLLKRHLPDDEYRVIYYRWLKHQVNWIATGWVFERPRVYGVVRALSRIVARFKMSRIRAGNS